MDRQPRRIVITGGAGFIGRALVARCVQEGHSVTVIDDLSVGRLAQLAPFGDRVAFRQVDILDAAAVGETMSQADADVVFHLAARHYIPWCTAHPEETLRVNVEGTHVVLSAAARHGARRAVIASSGALYRDAPGALGEDMPAAPSDVYGLSKQLAETVAAHITAQTDFSCLSARLFNVYGPYETNLHLVPEILKGLAAGRQVSLGNTHTRRDYIYVDDVADALLRCTVADDFRPVINIGTGKSYSASDIVALLADLLGGPIHIVTDPARVRTVDKLDQMAATDGLTDMIGPPGFRSLSEGLRALLVHEGLLRAQEVST